MVKKQPPVPGLRIIPAPHWRESTVPYEVRGITSNHWNVVDGHLFDVTTDGKTYTAEELFTKGLNDPELVAPTLDELAAKISKKYNDIPCTVQK